MTTTYFRNQPTLETSLRSLGNLPRVSGDFSTTYRLDATKVDVELARRLYYNQDIGYKLGAGFSRPAVDVPAGFMGVPKLTLKDYNEDAQGWLDRFVKEQSGILTKAFRMMMRDGRVLLRLQPVNRSPAYKALYRDDQDTEIVLVPDEAYEIVPLEEDVEAVEKVRITHTFLERDASGGTTEKKIIETIDAKNITFEYPDQSRETETRTNPLGFVPAVEIQNENEPGQLRASSCLEPMEPYMKFYNDVMLHAGSSSQLHSTAKLVLRVQDVEQFLKNNFTDTEIADKRLRFQNKDVLFFESGAPDFMPGGGSALYGEGADIIQAVAPLGDTTTLLKFIFRNIIDASEIPEWAFGAAVGSSKASVSEQSPPLIHLVNRKRNTVSNAIVLLGRMMLQRINQQGSERIIPEWDELGMRDLKTWAEAFRNVSDAVISLNDGEILSRQTGVELLRPFDTSIDPYDQDESSTERDRIDAEVEAKMAEIKKMVDIDPQLEEGDREASSIAEG